MMQKCKEIFLSIFTFSTEKKFSQVQNTDLKGYKKKWPFHTLGGGGTPKKNFLGISG